MMIDIFMGEGNEGNEVDDRDEEEVNVQDKSSEEQLGQIFNEILKFYYNYITLFIHSFISTIDIDMDDVEVVKSSDEQEQVTEEKELSQNKRRSSRRKSKNEREIVNDKDKIPARSSKMHIGLINMEIQIFFFNCNLKLFFFKNLILSIL